MKAFRLFLLLAACLLTAEVLRPFFSIPLDKDGHPVLFEDEDQMCAAPQGAGELELEAGRNSSGLV